MMGAFRDLTGQQFGRLAVVGIESKTRSGNYRWRVLCGCGAEKVVPSDHLVRKAQPVRSCGCYRDDQIRAACSPNPDGTAFRLLLGAYRKRARLKGLEFALSEWEFRSITSSDCDYCGAQPSTLMQNKPKTGQYVYNTIDRKDPTLGYVLGNCTPCCKTCNYMKWTLTPDEFTAQAKKIAEWGRRG